MPVLNPILPRNFILELMEKTQSQGSILLTAPWPAMTLRPTAPAYCEGGSTRCGLIGKDCGKDVCVCYPCGRGTPKARINAVDESNPSDIWA